MRKSPSLHAITIAFLPNSSIPWQAQTIALLSSRSLCSAIYFPVTRSYICTPRPYASNILYYRLSTGLDDVVTPGEIMNACKIGPRLATGSLVASNVF